MKNYIEYIHRTTDEDMESVDTYYAVSPTPDRYKSSAQGGWSEMVSRWTLLNGQAVHIYDQSDIDGLRMLLNEIEKEIAK